MTYILRMTVLIALLGAACTETSTASPDAGVTADSATALDATTSVDSGTDAPPPSADGGVRSVLGIAADSPDFTILAAAVTRAGLGGVLSGAGPLTVFAPDNAAFAASSITLEMVNTMSVDTLATILRYHVLTQRVASTEVRAGAVTTAADLSLLLGTTGGVRLNGGNAVAGGANVRTADIAASNGVMHVIDRVLLPPKVTDLARYGGLTSLANALTSAALVTPLEGAGPFTVFAPTNEAFTRLGTPPTGEALATVLRYHVVGARVLSTAIPQRANSIANNRYGNPMTLLFQTSGGVRINGTASVSTADLRATNGVVHVIDRVLVPMNAVDAATAAGLTSLLSAVTTAAPLPATGGGSPTPVAGALRAQAPYTIFAPTNEAFAAAASVTSALSAAQLRDVLLFHVLDTTAFPSPVLSTGLPSGASTPLRTLNGANATLNTTVTPPTIQSAPINVTDIHVTNGVIHVVGAVMIPPSR